MRQAVTNLANLIVGQLATSGRKKTGTSGQTSSGKDGVWSASNDANAGVRTAAQTSGPEQENTDGVQSGGTQQDRTGSAAPGDTFDAVLQKVTQQEQDEHEQTAPALPEPTDAARATAKDLTAPATPARLAPVRLPRRGKAPIIHRGRSADSSPRGWSSRRSWIAVTLPPRPLRQLNRCRRRKPPPPRSASPPCPRNRSRGNLPAAAPMPAPGAPRRLNLPIHPRRRPFRCRSR